MRFLENFLNYITRREEAFTLDIAGVWEGHYRYHTHNPLLRERTFSFEVIIDRDNELIHGNFIEKLASGKTDNQIRFYGKISGKKIEIYKQYNQFLIMAKNGDLYEDNRHEPPLIKYFGNYSIADSKYIGDWNMEYNIDGQIQFISGFWEMQKRMT